MDWAEELKMSIRKTTARKGRRSKSRDVLKDSTAPPSTSQTNSSVFSNSAQAQVTPSTNTDLSVDINLDLQHATSSTNSNNVSTASAGGNLTGGGGGGDISGTTSETKRPPMLRRISGGWADSGGGGKLRNKKGSFEDDRFGFKSSANISPTDDIPIIPDLDDFKDDILMNEIAEPPSVAVNRVVTLKELNSDLLAQNAFSAIEDVDLSILTRCLQPQESLDEADEVWEWEKLFTDVVADINADKHLENKIKALELRSDDVQPLNSQD